MPQSDSKAQLRALLQQGMQAARRGDRARASGLFQAVLEQDPDQEEAWLWLAALAESPEQSVVYLQRVLSINPHNTRAQAGLQWARQRIQAAEALPEAPIQPAWGGIVNLVPLEPEGTRWQWWRVVGLIGILLLAGGLVWWGAPKILQFVELARPEAIATEPMPTLLPPATDTPLPPTVTAIATAVAAIATETPSPVSPTVTAMATATPSATSSPVLPTATAIATETPSPLPPTATAPPTATPSPMPPTATAMATAPPAEMPSPVPTPATVWPTPDPTSVPQVTPEPTP